jgi:hypothetical protein
MRPLVKKNERSEWLSTPSDGEGKRWGGALLRRRRAPLREAARVQPLVRGGTPRAQQRRWRPRRGRRGCGAEQQNLER